MLLLSLLACDPQAPGASGVARFPTPAAPGMYLHVRSEAEGGVCPDERLVVTVPLQAGDLSVPYHTGHSLGACMEPRWQVTAWVSTNPRPEGPATGEPVGVAPFLLRDCGWGSYCGVVSGVDVTIRQP